MFLDILGISVETTTLYIVLILFGAFIAWYILGTAINNLFDRKAYSYFLMPRRNLVAELVFSF